MKSIFVFIFVISAVAVWFFIKKRPNKQYRNISIGVAIISFLLVGFTGNTNDEVSSNTDQSVANSTSDLSESKELIESTSSFESSESDTTSKTSHSSEKKVEIKNKIDLSNIKDMQFSGHANIQPIRAKIKKEKLTFDFDWRNDDGSVDERSFNGSGVTVIAYQNGTELEQLPETYSGVDQYIDKNQTLEINFEYKLIDHSQVTIKLLPLEGDSQEFSFDLTD